MCLIIFAYKVVPEVTLLVAANRDEWFNRPALPAGFWADHPHIVAGRDLQASGTWLGATRTGRFAALTNYRNPDEPRMDAPTRGGLVSGFLAGRQSAREYLEQLRDGADRYNGFSMLAADDSGMFWYSNRGDGQVQEIAPGVHGLSNHLLNTPWPKVIKGCEGMQRLLERSFSCSDYLDLMDDSVPEGERGLIAQPDTWTLERSLSSMRIMKGGYGTRCSTALRLTRRESCVFAERTYLEDGRVSGEAVHRFRIA